SLLIQLDLTDQEGLVNLKKMMEKAVGPSFPKKAKARMKKATEKLSEIVEGKAKDPEGTFGEVNALVEQVIDLIEAQRLMSGEEERSEERETVDENESKEDLQEESLTEDKEEAQEKAEENCQKNYMPEDADRDLIEEYIAESTDLLTRAEEALLTLETTPEDMEAVNTVFRAFHTIKGTSSFLELAIVSELAHHAESLLSRVREGQIKYGGIYADLSLRAIDMIKLLIDSVKEAIKGAPLLKPQGYDELLEQLKDPEETTLTETETETPEIAPRLGDILVAQGKVERQEVEEVASKKGDKFLGSELVKEKKASVTDVAQALRTQQQMKGNKGLVETSVRVRTDRLDRLIDMVGELVIAHSMVVQDEVIRNNSNHELQKKVAHTSKIVRELQNLSMSMRMVPLKSTFQKMARLVRDLANKTGKKVNFVTEGEDTEIDRSMVDLINDPLMHMVRNAVDHGIESPEERQQKGKPAAGTIKLSAYHSAGNVVVEIADDGKGLDRERIISKAREKGIIDDGASFSDRDVYNLIFEPGFSTAKEVTDISGRGVGMDVVKRNIEGLRGQVEISSEPGKGSTFQVSLPLTLAIIDGMVVRVGSERFIIPTISIVRSLRPKEKEVASVFGKGELLRLGEELIPIVRLADVCKIEGAKESPTNALIVVVEDNEKKTGLLVDELLGQQQIVIKSLGETMKDVPGISGGAIMADGLISLILDVGELIRFAHAEGELKGAA
ncbi:MAG: chemotaxis protein CheA, partial [Deltaproteobacteria bacterium]